MKPYLLYIINSRSSITRDMIVFATDSGHARTLGEECCLRNANERILCVYSKNMETF